MNYITIDKDMLGIRGTEHFKRHMAVITSVDGREICNQPIEDPFLRTRIVVGWTLWEWLKMLFTWDRHVEVVVHVRSDGVAQARWFRGEDVCTKCKRRPIGYPHDGSSASKPGYESGEDRLCESCYYGYEEKCCANSINGESS